mmetsp:Transcript_28923/g.67328  ORF Transcript_28923/g.67328 Transcript_28923/m.67328 type:complete len:1009 (-) Transcript_28923:278-3304(-)|eukprot:CAMPEP_0178455166 /NCGR_PEP_ID=MMETSP0689_2-20121128/45758_1 /TAXON_ID=160604 /ORGANISM="Amphidinium massartii, Strain CS-259" /LENGTH=1008 /DNA_ID=CAMNT_0020081171 /DNA_START=69 /DNA_END=3095 /DNA_ORIENTATION=+
MAEKRAIVVGGGLAGLTATCELLEQGCNVTVLEKADHLGGNSAKATCGIAAPGTSWQKAAGVEDSPEAFIREVGGADSGGLQKVIATGAADLEWLVKGLSLESEIRLMLTPGHRVKRTIRTKSQFPGVVVTMGAVNALDVVSKKMPERLKIVKKAEVTQLLKEGKKVCGVQYVKDGDVQQIYGPVILASGGFAGNYKQQCPALAGLPSCSSTRMCGDGVRIAQQAGVAVQNMNRLAVFPTAQLLDPSGSDALYISDAIPGAGGIFVDADGKRFVDELAPAEVVVAKIQAAKKPVRLIIGETAAVEVAWSTKFYLSKGVMKQYSSAKALASEMGVPELTLTNTFTTFNKAAADDVKGLLNATQKAANFLGTTKRHYNGNPVQDGQLFINPADNIFAATISGPAVQYSCGGLKTQDGKTDLLGLYACGEVCDAGISKIYCISGMSLLHCIVTGRWAAKACAAELVNGSAEAATSFKDLMVSAITARSGDDVEGGEKVEEKDYSKMSKEDLIKELEEMKKNGPPAAAAPAAPAGISLEEVAKHNTKGDAWVVINGTVCDVTAWIPVHPGGEQAILAFLGQDASDEWNAIHKPGMVEANQDKGVKILGQLGGGGGAAAPVAAGGGGGGGGLTMTDVKKHNTKADAWVVVNGKAYDVTKWIDVHPGGAQAIVATIGDDASEEWNMIHKPGTIEKYLGTASGPVDMGAVSGAAAAAPVAAAGAVSKPPPSGDGGVGGWPGAIIFLAINILKQVISTVFFTGNFEMSVKPERTGTIRSACFLLFFTIVHAGGNFLDFWHGGPAEVNGESYFFDRQRMNELWKNIPIPFGLIELYLFFALLLHVTVALKRSYDITINYCLYSGRWNMLLSGLVVLTFLTKHLIDFRFATDYKLAEIRPPKNWISFDRLINGYVWTEDSESGVKLKAVNDLYTKEYEVFGNFNNVAFYQICVAIFVCHMCWGWKKMVPSDDMQIPTAHKDKVIYMGWAAAIAIGAMYSSLPWAVYFSTPIPVHHVEA